MIRSSSYTKPKVVINSHQYNPQYIPQYIQNNHLNSPPRYQQAPHFLKSLNTKPESVYYSGLNQPTKQISTSTKTNSNNLIKSLQTKIKYNFKKMTTYEQLLIQYDRILRFDLFDQRLLMNKIFLLEAQMQPQNMHWIFWKNSDQVRQFLQDIQYEILNMMRVSIRKFKTGDQIHKKYLKTYQNWILMNQNQKNQTYGQIQQKNLSQFIELLNLIGEHPYLNKTVQYLCFVHHCLPIDKTNMLIYQQLYIRKPFNVLDKVKDIFTDDLKKRRRKKDFFLTITSDGILKSDDHLLLSKVDTMIPFTNLMKVSNKRKGDDIIYKITSGRSETLKLNFYDDYVAAINFACGLGKARIQSFYKAPYKAIDQNRKYNRQYYEKQQIQNTVPHRFNSFAPPRQNCSVKLYNDGCGYFEDMYECLMNAKNQICITDWMLTPYFLLRRPGSIKNQNIQNRLDGVLAKAAERGVKIFIILFMQPAMFVNNDSQGAASHLQKMHKNIKVLRHPNVAVPIIWSHHQKLCVIDQKIGFMGGLDICYGRWDTPEHKLVQNITQRQKKLWDGCDYNNFRTKDIYTPRDFQNTNLNQDFQVRMPWHDIALQMRGDSVVDLLRHFVQYWYFVKSQYKLSPRKLLSDLRKRDPNIQKRHIGSHMKQAIQQSLQQKYQQFKYDVADQFFPGRQERISQLLIEQRTGMNQGNTNIQMLRSANTWSIGADPKLPERSIHQAYKDLIKKAQKHIYIENQFFMGLKNQIVKTLCERIIKAYNNKQQFRVIIVVPLLPGFEGDPGDPAATVLRIQVHWQKVAIKNGDESIYSILSKNCPGININDYLFFFGLRTHDVLRGSPITQIIYVHSKLMIVDDKRAICGSANINDRSLWGTGDSQIAICIQQNQKSNHHLFDLRCRIYDEHFKLTRQQCKQITTTKIWNMLLQRARTNTLIYRQVFGCIPDDYVTTHQQIQILSSQANYKAEKLKGIIGHAVQYPLKFMDDQDLQFSIGQKEYYAPVESFT